jgi:hypothetical protein
MPGKILYITHCCAKKNISLKGINKSVTPDKLYTATPTQRFMKTCQEKGVNWAIFSDKYDIWFSDEMNSWYEKNPKNVSAEEFKSLVNNCKRKLKDFDEVRFYHNPGRFHDLYKRLVTHPDLKDKIKPFSHLYEIV